MEMPRRPASPVGLRPLIGLLVAAALLPAPGAAQETPFTVDDVFDVASLQVRDLSDDGDWVAVTRLTLNGRLGLDSHRYGDPTYVAPASGRLLAVNTRTGEELDVLGRDAHVVSASWSPDGTELAVLTYAGDGFRLRVYDRIEGRLRTVDLPAGTRVAGERQPELLWTGEASLLLPLYPDDWAEEAMAEFRRLTEGPITVYSADEPFLAWEALRRRGGTVSLAELDLERGTIREIVPTLAIGRSGYHVAGNALVYEADVTEKTSYDVIFGATSQVRAVPLAGGESRTVLDVPEDRRVQWSRQGSHYAFGEKGAIYSGSIDDPEPALLIGPDPEADEDAEPGDPDGADDQEPERFTLQGLAPDGSAVVASSREGVWHVDTGSGERILMIPQDEDDDEAPRHTVIGFSPDADVVYLQYTSRTEWERGVSAWSEGRGLEPLVRDGRLYSGFSLAESGARFVFSAAPGNRPLDLYAADPSFEAQRPLTRSNRWLDGRALGDTELIRYLDVDGDRLNGVVYYPPDYEPGVRYPTVFVVYEEFFDDRFNSTVNVLTNAGYVVMQPSVDLEIGFPGEAWLKGVTAAANALIEKGVSDPDRLGVHGTSYGGYATNLLVTQTNRFKAAINISGKVDMISFYTDSPRLGVRNIHAPENSQDRIGATLWEQPQKYIDHSAIMFADRIETPLLLLTGEEDHNVPARTTMEMYYALRRLGKTVMWVNYVNGGHGMPRTNEGEVRDYHRRILDWYEEYLGEDRTGAEVTSGS